MRLPLDQHRSDRRAGLRTASFVSGYQGSPLAGLDKELERNAEICREHHVFHVPGVNEELGATAAWGSQLAAALPGARYDGVVGLWYGKAPGLDRAMDSLRHGNFAGVGRAGGGLAIVGDDPSCKSSTLPSASERALQSLQMPTFFPGSVQDVLDLGLHAIACSRASGLWSGLKVDERVTYKKYRNGSESSIETAQADLILAKNALKDAQDAYDSVSDRAEDDVDRAAALSALGAARRAYEHALANLNYLLALPNVIDVNQAEAVLVAAQAEATSAQAEYDKLKTAPTRTPWRWPRSASRMPRPRLPPGRPVWPAWS